MTVAAENFVTEGGKRRMEERGSIWDKEMMEEELKPHRYDE